MPLDPVLIEQHGGAFRVTRGDELLLVVPRALFESYTQDTVFPPSWEDTTGGAHPVRRLYWNPTTRQFLMAGLERHPARVVEGHGVTAYRSFLQGFWLPEPPVLLLRPFWNPPDPYAPFDQKARAESLAVQLRFYSLLAQMRPPDAWTAILNATQAYLEALGITSPNQGGDPGAIQELTLVSPHALGRPPATRLLDALSQEHLREVFPVLRNGALCGVHALGMSARHGVEALLKESDTPYYPGVPRPH